ncbi:hypothetical protein MMC30_007178 [Trapelia coarctata]|nr:hypothetical protein [Trapelia coarctata]
MAPLLRRRLTCFYCGRRSTKKYTPGLQQFGCETCEAVNHLDKNGEITDPPALNDAPSTRYAQAIERPTSPVFDSPDETLFCPTCLKNQYFLTQSLASYLPPPTDPKYPEYERKYPEYRKGLEERYPQVCENCQPRVEERIRATGYAAKTDHLRRMMDKTRSFHSLPYEWRWRHIIVYAGALGWWAGLLGQILWNVLGAVAKRDGELREDTASESLRECLQRGLSVGWNATNCVESAQSLATVTLVSGLLSIWWNPCLATKLHGRPGRMVGLSEFYKLQGIVALSRLSVWYALGRSKDLQLDLSTFNAIHATMVALNLVVSVISFRTARIDTTPTVNFQESPEPLRYRKPIPIQHLSTHPVSTTLPWTPSSSQDRPYNSQPRQVLQPFPVNSLATPPRRVEGVPYQPPTPPPEYEADAMDWTPAKAEFQPTRSVPLIHQPTPRRIESSPFIKKLPPAPISQAHRLRNPPNQPTFRKATDNQQRNFADGLRRRGSRTAYAETESTERDYDEETESPTTPVTLDSPRRLEMATPKFFPRSDFSTDTGLESLFTGVFSLADDPPEVRAAQKVQEEQAASHRKHAVKRAAWERIGGIVLLSFAFWAWSYAERAVVGAQTLRFTALGSAAVVSGRGLFEAFRMDKAYWRLSDILVLGVELAVVIFLGRAVKSSGMRDYTLGSGPLWFLGMLLLQEFGTFATEMRTSIAGAEPTPFQAQSTTQAPSSSAGSNGETATASSSHPERSLALARQSPEPVVETESSQPEV